MQKPKLRGKVKHVVRKAQMREDPIGYLQWILRRHNPAKLSAKDKYRLRQYVRAFKGLFVDI